MNRAGQTGQGGSSDRTHGVGAYPPTSPPTIWSSCRNSYHRQLSQITKENEQKMAYA
jgi:hypothetical protein